MQFTISAYQNCLIMGSFLLHGETFTWLSCDFNFKFSPPLACSLRLSHALYSLLCHFFVCVNLTVTDSLAPSLCSPLCFFCMCINVNLNLNLTVTASSHHTIQFLSPPPPSPPPPPFLPLSPPLPFLLPLSPQPPQDNKMGPNDA